MLTFMQDEGEGECKLFRMLHDALPALLAALPARGSHGPKLAVFTADGDILLWTGFLADRYQLYIVRLPVHAAWGDHPPICRANAIVDLEVLDASRVWGHITAAAGDTTAFILNPATRRSVVVDVCAAFTLAFGSDFCPPFCVVSLESMVTVLAHVK